MLETLAVEISSSREIALGFARIFSEVFYADFIVKVTTTETPWALLGLHGHYWDSMGTTGTPWAELKYSTSIIGITEPHL